MMRSDRRAFLGDVGTGMLAALVGPSLLGELGLGSVALGDEKAKPAEAGLERLARLLQSTAPDKIFGVLKTQLDQGTGLRSLVAAGALANANAFAGQDYDGYHTFMALAPAYTMAVELPKSEQPLPIFKVLYRNSTLIAHCKAHDHHLDALEPMVVKSGEAANQLVELGRQRKVADADRIALGLAKQSPEAAYNEIQPLMQDILNVHRVVLTWRAWEILDFTGKEHAQTMLRQSVRHCADYQNHSVGNAATGFPAQLTKLLDQHKLLEKPAGTRKADDVWIEKLSQIIYADKQAAAAEAVAMALAEGFSADSIGEAISLAATKLVLGDPGRTKAASDQKPVGSVHGDSVGVHASDAANAWRHIAAVANARNTAASLIAGAYHTAGQGGPRQLPNPYPLVTDVEQVTSKDADVLRKELDEAIRGKDQKRAAAIAQRYGELGHPERELFGLLRSFAVSQEGALHAEKYFRTTSEEFARSRPAFRWKHAVALARVTASLYGWPGAGLDEARKVLKA